MDRLILMLSLCCLSSSMLTQTTLQAAADHHYQVAVAKVDITPEEPILQSGYASRRLVEIEKVEQRLYARAIAIGSAATQPAIITTVDNGKKIDSQKTNSNSNQKQTPSAAETIQALVAEVKVGTADEYRNIPAIWRAAIAAGRRNKGAELLTLLDASLPKANEKLHHWQAVVIGGGIINGITLAGDWPGERVDKLIGKNKSLRDRWMQALQAAIVMADDQKVKSGTRYDALRMVALLPWKQCGTQLIRYANQNESRELQQGAVSGLGDVPDKQATTALIACFGKLAPRNQKIAAEALIRSEQRISALLAAVKAGQIPPPAIPVDVKKQLHQHSQQKIRTLSKKLLP